MKRSGKTRVNSSLSVFEVRLRCEAAPEIGCGLRAKPFLQDLERLPGVGEAWLSRAGNRIAIVRTARFQASDESVLEISRKHRVALRVLRADDYTRAVADFAETSGWYRADGVDQLSSEEAHVIATRLVNRLRARIKLTDSEERKLSVAIEAACVGELVRNPTQSASARKRRIAQVVLNAANKHLDARALAAFTEAAQQGHAPLPGEK